jgi:serine/threonine-protein kinase
MIGRTVGNYRIVEKLGEGAMGTVYRAVDQMVDRNVAIKVLKPEIAQNAETLERFHREAVALARLNHPSIAQLYAFFREGDEYFMAMEFVPGETLDARIARQGRLPWPEALKILTPVLEGVGHAHSQGILHRDLKPANIMLATDGRVKVMDFGIASIQNTSRLTREARLVGTLEYLAPERALGKAPDARSDIYSLGMVLYEMLTGRLPFTGDTDFDLIRAQLNQKVPRPRELGIALPPPIEELVMTALEKDPARRFQDAATFQAAAAKAALAAESGVATGTAEMVRRRSIIASGVAVALLVTGLCGLGIWKIVSARRPLPAPAASASVALAQATPLQVLGPTVTLSSIDRPPAQPPAALPESPRQTAAPNMADVAAALATGGAAPLQYASIYKAARSGGALGAPLVIQTVERRGVDFRLSRDQSRQLRAAGAPDTLLQAIRGSYRETRAAVPQPPAPQAAAPARPPELAPPAVERPAPTPAPHRRIEILKDVDTLFIHPMPNGFDDDMREAIAKEVGSRLHLVSKAADADAYLEISLDGDKGHAVLGSTQRWLGLKGGQKAVVRMVEARGGRLLWSAEAGDRSVFASSLGDGARRIASRLAKRLKHDLHD